MFKLLLATVLLAAAAYFSWKKLTPPPLTVEEKIAAVLNHGGCSAAELAELSNENPKAVEKTLKGRMVAISGVLSRALTKGVDSSDLILELRGNPQRKIDFTSDFQQFTRMSDGIRPGDFKFRKFGHEMVMLARQKKTNAEEVVESGGKSLESFEPTVVFREGDRVTLKGMLKHVGKHNVAFELREMP